MNYAEKSEKETKRDMKIYDYTEQYFKKLNRPQGKVRVVVDTDTYNEIDDQYALSYALRKQNRLQVEAIYAAPFYNDLSESPADGMEKSYAEILKLLQLLRREDMQDKVFRGSRGYLLNENTPQESEAARHLVNLAMSMPEGELLYVVAIAAITNVASAILMEPGIADKIVVVWLGGHAHYWNDTKEFNMIQDVAAARVIFDSNAPIVQIPCMGVTSHLLTTEPELRNNMKEQGAIGKYLYDITCSIAERQEGACWSRVIWDLAPMMWLAGPKDCMMDCLTHSPVVSYEGKYSEDTTRRLIKVVERVNRDKVFAEFFATLADREKEENGVCKKN